MSSLLERVDHLVYATTELERGVAEITELLDVLPIAGGRHPGKGTRNALIALGPRSYLEIIGPDPEQPDPPEPRTFGIDTLASSKLVTWAASGQHLGRLREGALNADIPLGAVRPASRQRADGVLLSWEYTDPGAFVADGIVPFFIDWGSSPHPAESSPKGATLVRLRGEHSEAARVREMLHQLGLAMEVLEAREPALIAEIETSRGRVELR